MRHEILIRYLSTLRLMEMQHVILSQNVSVSAVDTAHMRDLNVRSLYSVRQFNDFAGRTSLYVTPRHRNRPNNSSINYIFK
jgi:hypothetical protein